MANVKARMSFSFIDNIGVPASASVNALVDDTTTVAAIMTEFQDYVEVMAGVSDDGVVEASIDLLGSVSGLSAPAALSDSEQGALLNFSQSGSRYSYGLWIPGLKDSLVVDGKLKFDVGGLHDLDVLFTSGGGNIVPVSKYYLVLDVLTSGAEAFRKLRRRAEKITRTINPG